MNKGVYWLICIAVALLLLAFNHLGTSFGDSLFRALDIPPWTGRDDNGLHITAVSGLVLLFAGIAGATRYYRPKYPKVMSRLIIGCIVFFIVSPFISEGAMFILKYNAAGNGSIDVTKSECSVRAEDNQTVADCSFTLFNYGKAEHISIKPVFREDYMRFADVSFSANTLSLDRHSKGRHVQMRFIGPEGDANGTSYTREVTMQYEVLK